MKSKIHLELWPEYSGDPIQHRCCCPVFFVANTSEATLCLLKVDLSPSSAQKEINYFWPFFSGKCKCVLFLQITYTRERLFDCVEIYIKWHSGKYLLWPKINTPFNWTGPYTIMLIIMLLYGELDGYWTKVWQEEIYVLFTGQLFICYILTSDGRYVCNKIIPERWYRMISNIVLSDVDPPGFTYGMWLKKQNTNQFRSLMLIPVFDTFLIFWVDLLYFVYQ